MIDTKAIKPVWRFILTAMSAGMIVAVFPMLEIYPLAWFALVPALISIKGASSKQAFWLGFCLNALHKIGSTYWLVYTINYYGEFSILFALFVFAMMIGALGVIFGLLWHLLGRAVNEIKVPMLIAAPVAWVAYEHVITVFLGGFPWVLYGYSLFPDFYGRQLADVVSVYGLSFCLVLVNAALAELILYFTRNRERFPVVPIMTAALIVAGLHVYGLVRVPQIKAAMDKEAALRVGVVQGNIDQFDKRRGDRDAILEKYRRLSFSAVAAGPDLIVWPETSVPGYQNRDMPPRPFVVELAQDLGVPMLLGEAVKYTPARGIRINYNTANLYSADGVLLGSYGKNHMVPFGEYVPLKDFLKLVAPEKAERTLGFSPSGRYNVIEPYPGPLGVMICYEAIYPAHSRTLANMGLDYYLNITNDAWFGDTSAPRQHLKMTAMRAVENRRWIARAANTGISAIVDPLGDVRSMTDYRVDAEFVDTIGRLRIRTIYQSAGDVVAIACGLLAMAAAIMLAWRAWRIWGLISGLGLAGACIGLYLEIGPSAGLLVFSVGLWLIYRARLIERGRMMSWIAFAALGIAWPLMAFVGWGTAFSVSIFAFETAPTLVLGMLIRRDIKARC